MDVLLTSKQFAGQAGLSVRTLERLRSSGLGPKFCKLGHSVRYRESDVIEWLASQTVRSTSEAEVLS
jgi:predicted DNA-binding transcriptional regulator AlpA